MMVTYNNKCLFLIHVCVCGRSVGTLSHIVPTTGLRLVEQSLSGILLVTVAEDKEGSGRFEIGSKMVMTSVPCAHSSIGQVTRPFYWQGDQEVQPYETLGESWKCSGS